MIKVGALVVSIIIVCGLGGCLHSDIKSKWFEQLLREHSTHGLGRYVLYDRRGLESVDLEIQLNRLIGDGFILDVGRLPELTYINCGSFVLPLGDDRVIFRKPEELLHQGNFRIWITIDDACHVNKVVGLSLERTQL